MYHFGVGKLWAVPFDGSTPVEFGILQDVSVGFSWDKKELHGSSQFPVKIVRSKGAIEGKAAFARINGLAFNLLLAGTASKGQKKVETVTVNIPEEPHEISVEPGITNLGVYDVSNNTVAIPMKLVTSAPQAGEYQFDAVNGKYIFAAEDAGKQIMYSYMTTTAEDGTTIVLSNPEMGNSPVFKAVLNGKLDGKQITLVLNCCMTTKFDLAFKQEDFLIPSFDFSAFADATGSPGVLTLGE